MNSPGLERQRQIYLRGFAGRRPSLPFRYDELEAAARSMLSPQAFAYVAGGAGSELTMRANREAFERVKIVPRMLRNVSTRNLEIDLFGVRYPTPFLLSPIGVLELFHADADTAVGRAAANAAVPFIFSNQASVAMEPVASQMGDATRWFQLYWSKSRELVASFVSRAEACGCSAIVVTLDTTMLGWRARDLSLGYLPFLRGMGIAQYTSDPVFQRMMDEPDDSPAPEKNISFDAIRGLVSMVNRYPGAGFLNKLRSGRPLKAVRKFIATYSNPAVTWQDLSFLREATRLPILLKGILHDDDAARAIDSGMNGIIVSNHGGRQVDGAIATLDALPAIVSRVRGSVPVLIDSGVRSGSDAFKALALGASAVCIGRPYVYALTLGGEQAVTDLIKNFVADLDLTMGLAGCARIGEIYPGCVAL